MNARIKIENRNGSWYIVADGVDIHLCPTKTDAEYIVNGFYQNDDGIDKALAIRKGATK